MSEHIFKPTGYQTVGKQLRYFIVYDADDNEVVEGSYYDVLLEMNWSDEDFDRYINNYRRPSLTYKKIHDGSFQIIELLPDDEKDEISKYYDLLLKIKDQHISFDLILEVIEASNAHNYLEKFSDEGVQLGLFNLTSNRSMPEKIAINLIMRTYAFLTIAEDLYLDEISEYYKIPLWLVILIDEKYYHVF